MKKLTMQNALQQAREGKIEFLYDAKLGVNELRGKKFIEIVSDTSQQKSFHRFADRRAQLNNSFS